MKSNYNNENNNENNHKIISSLLNDNNHNNSNNISTLSSKMMMVIEEEEKKASKSVKLLYIVKSNKFDKFHSSDNSHKSISMLLLILVLLLYSSSLLNCYYCIDNDNYYNNNNNNSSDSDMSQRNINGTSITKYNDKIMKQHEQSMIHFEKDVKTYEIDNENADNNNGDDENIDKSITNAENHQHSTRIEESTMIRSSSSSLSSSSAKISAFNESLPEKKIQSSSTRIVSEKTIKTDNGKNNYDGDDDDDDENDDKDIIDENSGHDSIDSTATTTSTTTKRPTTTIRSSLMTTLKSVSKNKTKSNHKKKRKNSAAANQSTTNETSVIVDYDDQQSNNTCLIGDVCGHKQMGYCHRPHEPKYIDIDDVDSENFYDLLLTSCPHFFDDEENLRHPLCCNAMMEDTMAKLIMSVDLIQRSCPSCLTNVKKLFCNLFCAPNQRDFIRINLLKGDMVTEVSYVLSELFVEKFYQSCHDVQVFGAYLMDFDTACGNLTRKHCTPKDFLEHLGSLQEIPFRFKPIIVSDETEFGLMATKKQPNEWPRFVMNETAYACDEAPPGLSTCRCDHCANMCLYGQYNPHIKKSQQSNNKQDDNDVMLQQQSNRIGRHTKMHSSHHHHNNHNHNNHHQNHYHRNNHRHSSSNRRVTKPKYIQLLPVLSTLIILSIYNVFLL